MGKQAINQQAHTTVQQSTHSDSLGIISLQSSHSQGIQFPYAHSQQQSVTDTLQLQEQVVQSPKVFTDNQSVRFPYIVSNIATEPDFSVSMFEYGDSVDFSHKLEKAKQKEFTQEFKEKVFVINYKQINETTNNWMFWLILGVLVLFGWSRLFYKKQLDLLMSAILHYNFAVKGIRNASENSQRFSNMLQFIFSVNIALFTYQVYNYFVPLTLTGFKALGVVLIITIAFLLLYGVKDMFYKFLGFIFNEQSYAYEYLFNVHLYNRVLGLFLFPVIIAFGFVQEHVIDHKLILYAGFLMLVIFFIFRIIRGIQISIKANVSILYMFLYFCTLEILPIAILVKFGSIVLNAL